MVAYCSAPCCRNLHDKRLNIQFHGFPLKRPAVLQQWISAVNRDNWTPTKSSKLCSVHFVDADYKVQNGNALRLLNEDAVPSIFNSTEDSSTQRLLKLSLINDTRSVPTYPSSTKIQKLSKYVDVGTSPKRSLINDTRSVPTCPSATKIQKLSKYVDVGTSPINVKLQSPETIRLRHRIKILQQMVRRKNKKIKALADLIKHIRNSAVSADSVRAVMEGYFKDFPLEFLMQQHENRKKAVQHRKYSDAMKDFALTIHFYSPQAYRFIRERFILPDMSTIRQWVSQMNARVKNESQLNE